MAEPDNSIDAVDVDAAQVRRSRRGKAAVFTKTAATAEGLLGKQSSKRLLKRYKEKITALFKDIEKMNNRLLDLLTDEIDHEAACVWLAAYEEKFEAVSCAIEDELEDREDEASSKTASVCSKVERYVSSIHISDAEPIPDEPIEELEITKTKSDVLKPEKLPFDHWITTKEHEPCEFTTVDSTTAMTDTLVGLNLKLKPFSGDPLEYHEFVTSFRHQVHQRSSLTACAKMAHLLNNLSGAAKLAVEGLSRDERGYYESLQILKELFGNKIRVSRAYINRVAKGPPISGKDPSKLRSLYHELFACWSALDRMSYFDDANSSTTLIEIVKRLPLRIQDRWKQQVVKIRQKDNTPALKELVDFMRQEVLAATDAVWGEVGSTYFHDDQNGKERSKSARVLVTVSKETKCAFCKGEHKSWSCDNIPADFDERKSAVRQSGACFNCLSPGHPVAKCSSKHSCKKCGSRHHTLLHAEKSEPSGEKSTASETSHEVISASAVHDPAAFLQIVAVEVIGAKGSTRTNALLDTGSQLTLLSRDLASAVGLVGLDTKLSVSTVTGHDKPTKAKLVTLGVKGLETGTTIEIPQAYVVKDFQLTAKQPSKRQLKSYEHIRDIQISPPVQGKGIELIIGANVPEILIPLESRKGKENEPVAIRTPLGWSLFGGSGSKGDGVRLNSVSAALTIEAGHASEVDDIGGSADQAKAITMATKLTAPASLWQPEEEWPQEKTTHVPESELELKKEVLTAATQATPEVPATSKNGLERLISRYSSWYKIKRIIATCFLFISRCKKEGSDTTVTVELMSKSEIALAKFAQREEYALELTGFNKEKKTVPRKSKIITLCPTLFDDGVLRVGSRLQYSDLEESVKNPIIIPRRHPLAETIVQDAHHAMAHGGVEAIMAEVRQRFWIPGLRQMVKSMSKHCIPCRKQLARRMQQAMAPLPKTRVTMTTPFDSTGVDFFGPFVVRVKRSSVKRWACLFTCFSTRAVHLESTSSMDTDQFINVLRRFKARRGNPSHMYSDNGTNFVGAERELASEIKKWNQDAIRCHLQQHNTEWHFNPPAAPHMGGVWERIIASVKRSLKAILRNQTVDQETFDTILTEVEGILNARPLTSCSDDPQDLESLTPNHFLLVKASPSLAPGQFSAADVLLRKHWRRAQALVQSFWKRWCREYLTTLHQRTKWTSPSSNLGVDDLVLISEDNVPRGQWKVARVVTPFVGPDGLVRSALLKTQERDVVRPVAKLCLLERSTV